VFLIPSLVPIWEFTLRFGSQLAEERIKAEWEGFKMTKHELSADVRRFEWQSGQKLALVSFPNATIYGASRADISFYLPAGGFRAGQKLKILIEPNEGADGGIECT
jgi:hypothetical protein